MIELLLRSLLHARPNSIRKYISNFFRDPELRVNINEYLEVRKTREQRREHESENFTKRTDDLTKWRNVLHDNRANEKHARLLETKEMEKKRKLENSMFVEYIKTEYFDGVCELFLDRPQYTSGGNNLLRERVAEFLKKYFKSREEIKRLIDHFDVVFREKEILLVVKSVLDEIIEKCPVNDVASPSAVLCQYADRENNTKVLFKVSDSWDVDTN